MISGKTIFIAHGWSDVSLNLQAKSLALALSKSNKVIFFNAKKGKNSIRQINKNLSVYDWPGRRPVGLRDFLFAIKKTYRHKPDIIITNFAANDIMLFTSWLFRVKTRMCYFHTMVQQYIEDHGKIGLKQQTNMVRKGVVFRLATHMLPSTEASKKDLIKYYKVRGEHAFVFPNALPDTKIRNTRNVNRIGFLGRLDRSKGVDLLIEAFKKLNEVVDGCELVIVGKGQCENELKALVKKLELEDKVLFKGSFSYEKVPDFLSRLTFLVVPSRMDNLPTVALEALSVGTPVIGSNAGGIPDIVIDSYNGLLFESENSNDLYKKMLHLLNNPNQREQMGVNARKTFEEKYCVDQLLNRFENLIENTF